MPSCDVYIVRHGERLDERPKTDPQLLKWAASVMAGASSGIDPPLTDAGFLQAVQAARLLRTLLPDEAAFDTVYSSPLQRCIRTAEAFSSAFNKPITPVSALGEACAALRMRAWKGDARHATRKHHPEILRRIGKRWASLLSPEKLAALCPTATFAPADDGGHAPGSELFIDHERGTSVGGRLAMGKQRVLLVTHREALRNTYSEIFRRAGQPACKTLPTPYACCGHFVVHEPGTADERWEFRGVVTEQSISGPDATGDDPHATREQHGEPVGVEAEK